MQIRVYIIFIFIASLVNLYAKTTPCNIIIDGISAQGTCKGILKHGKFVGYYPNGMIAWEVHYKDDKLHGKFRHFYTNGNPHFIGSYKHGVLNGDFMQYSEDNMILHTHFKKGVLHNWLYTIQNGVKIQALQYYYGKLVAQKYLN